VPTGRLPHCCSRCKAALSRARRRQTVSRGGLHQVLSRGRHAPLHHARRWQALPARGLLQVGSRRHGPLCGAWRGQALPAPGLPQGCCWRRHAPLHRAWGRQALPARGLPQDSRSSSRQCVLHAMSPARAARQCTRRCIATPWRGPGAPSHGWDRGVRASSTSGGGWRVRGHPQASDRSKVIKLAGDVYLQDCM
jgi:hypothetical protein